MLEPKTPRCLCDAALERTRGRREEDEETLEHIVSHALTLRLQGLTSQELTILDGWDNGHSTSHDAPFQTGHVSTTAADDLPSHNENPHMQRLTQLKTSERTYLHREGPRRKACSPALGADRGEPIRSAVVQKDG